METKERLARELDTAARMTGDARLKELAKHARAGLYSDFESPLSLPKVALVEDLIVIAQTTPAIVGLINLVKQGEFDDTKAEAQAWYKREGKSLGKHLS
jgi:hypothetical protein